MERESAVRLLRRICMAFLAVFLVLALCAPAMAEETAPAGEDGGQAAAAAEQDDFAAVRAQLEAVAREDGRRIAGQMLFDSFRAISPAQAPADEAQATAEPPAAAGGTPSVVVHAEQKASWSFSGLLPFLIVLAATAGMLVALSVRRSQRAFSPQGYRPTYDRTFRDETPERRSVMRTE